jgi:hypothetical protein
MLILRLTQNEMIDIVAETHITRIGVDGSVDTVGKDGEIKTIKADKVVIAQGRDPLDDMVAKLIAEGVETHVIGDSHKVGRVGHAVHDAYHALRAMTAQRIKATELAC